MATASTAKQAINWEDVQGLVLHAYGHHRYTANLLLQIDDAVSARGWLTALLPLITTATRFATRPEECYFNVAFTRSGLAKLGLSDQLLATFPTAFFEGAASANRSRILGDIGESDPKKWLWGGTDTPIDALLLVFANDPGVLVTAVQQQQSAFKGVSLEMQIDTQVSADQTEHFGFHDGISQPVIENSPPLTHPRSTNPNPVYGDSNLIKAGEFLLGYLNEYGVLPDAPDLPLGSDPKGFLPTVANGDGATVPDLGRNGSFLVLRQIAQHVAQLWQYLDSVTHDSVKSDELAAKLIGRWKSGAPMVLTPLADDPSLSESNDFVYKAEEKKHPMHDPEGMRCPWGAHVRRSNPRDTLGDDRIEALKLTKRHRLMRRGRSYGPRIENPRDLSDAQERGLLFMCINANIERQFEFVQQTWVNNPSFNGLYNERDPIFGDASGQKDGCMTIPREPVRQRLQNLGGFVTIRGGAYFFLPGINALSYLGGIE